MAPAMQAQSPTIRQMTPSTSLGTYMAMPTMTFNPSLYPMGYSMTPPPQASQNAIPTGTIPTRSVTFSTPSSLGLGNICSDQFPCNQSRSTTNPFESTVAGTDRNPFESEVLQNTLNPFMNNTSGNNNNPFANVTTNTTRPMISHVSETVMQPTQGSRDLDITKQPSQVLHNSELGKELDLMFGSQPIPSTIPPPIQPTVNTSTLVDTTMQPTMTSCHPCNKKVEPPTYNGKEKWDTFISLFEKVADINNWEGSDKCKRLLVSLRGSALEFADTLQLKVTKDFDLLKEAFASRFGVTSNESLYRVKFKGRRRNANETLDKFMQELQYLAERAYPNEKGEIYYRLITEQFIEGLNNRECKNYLKLNLNVCQSNTSGLIQEVLKYAHNYESVMGRSDQMQKPFQEPTNVINPESESRPQNNSYRSNQQGNRIPRKIICHYCQGEGHIKSRCPLKEQHDQENSKGLH
ncbi:MAG: hypothetical protein AB2693_31150 [Candidatus Thiodiazotropha sp.]